MRWRARCATVIRAIEQRRSDALGVLGHGGDRLACGCDDPRCDAAGHTIAYPVGPTQAANLKCLCRKHK
jgi:hypothetical protein